MSAPSSAALATTVLAIAGDETLAKIHKACTALGWSMHSAPTMSDAVAATDASSKAPFAAIVAALGMTPETFLFDRGGGDRGPLFTAAQRVNVPVIVFSHTACANEEHQRACFDAGAVAVVSRRRDLVEAFTQLQTNRRLRATLVRLNHITDDLSPKAAASSSADHVQQGVDDFPAAAEDPHRPWSVEEYPTIARRLAYSEQLVALREQCEAEDDQMAQTDLARMHARVKRTFEFSEMVEAALPSLLLPRAAYALRPQSIVRFCVVSDTHAMHSRLQLPAGEVLIHCGDLVGNYGGGCRIADQALDVAAWLSAQPFRRVFVVPGNHDTVLDATAYPEHAAVRRAFLSALAPHVTLLEQSAATYRGLRVWGSPVLVSRIETQGQRYHSDAFETREAARTVVWEQIPEALDVLVTHTPSFGAAGDALLAARLQRMTRPPRVHCFGHAHKEVGVGLHPDGAAQWPGDAEDRAKRVYINAAQERILGGEHGSGGCAWVFDLEVAAGQ